MSSKNYASSVKALYGACTQNCDFCCLNQVCGTEDQCNNGAKVAAVLALSFIIILIGLVALVLWLRGTREENQDGSTKKKNNSQQKNGKYSAEFPNQPEQYSNGQDAKEEIYGSMEFKNNQNNGEMAARKAQHLELQQRETVNLQGHEAQPPTLGIKQQEASQLDYTQLQNEGKGTYQMQSCQNSQSSHYSESIVNKGYKVGIRTPEKIGKLQDYGQKDPEAESNRDLNLQLQSPDRFRFEQEDHQIYQYPYTSDLNTSIDNSVSNFLQSKQTYL